jgi:DNA-binding transcriptional ArsR family regulator
MLGYVGKLEEPFIPLFSLLLHDLDIKEVVILSKIINNFNYFKDNNKLDNEGYCYILFSYISADTGYSYRSVTRAVKIIKDKGYIDTKIKGMPKKRFMKLNYDKIRNEIMIGKIARESRVNDLIEKNSLENELAIRDTKNIEEKVTSHGY